MLKTSAIIVAAGKGKRMERDYNKQYIHLQGKPIIAHTLEKFQYNNLIDEIILVVAKGEIEEAQTHIVEKYGFTKVTKVIEGGQERQDSVYKGLTSLCDKCSIVLIHDGARPFVDSGTIKESIAMAKESGAVIVAMPVKDTIKIINENMEVESTPNRDTLWAVQTPQVFQYELLIKAYEKLKQTRVNVTDDATLVEQLGYPVKVIKGSYENIKITTPEDLIIGEGILNKRGGKKQV